MALVNTNRYIIDKILIPELKQIKKSNVNNCAWFEHSKRQLIRDILESFKVCGILTDYDLKNCNVIYR